MGMCRASCGTARLFTGRLQSTRADVKIINNASRIVREVDGAVYDFLLDAGREVSLIAHYGGMGISFAEPCA
jgi:hypothetical protein